MTEWSPPRAVRPTSRWCSAIRATAALMRVGRGWGLSFQRFVETVPPWSSTTNMFTPLRRSADDRVGTGATHTDTAEHQHGGADRRLGGDAEGRDAVRLLRRTRHVLSKPAGARWTLTWASGRSGRPVVQAIVGPFGRRTTFAYDGSGMVRRVQDPAVGSARSRWTGPEPGAGGHAGSVRDQLRVREISG